MDEQLYQELLNIFKDELQETQQILLDTLLLLEHSNKTELNEHLQTLFRAAHNIKGAAQSVSLDDVSTLAHQLEDQFSVWREGTHKPKKSEVDEMLSKVDGLTQAFEKTLQKDNKEDVVLKIPLSKIELANTKADEFITHRLQLENWSTLLDENLKRLQQTKKNMLQDPDSGMHALNETIQQLTYLSENSGQFIGEFSRSVQGLQDELRNMRLVQIETILAPIKRTLRELTTSMDKDVKLNIQGGDVEIDKAILDLLKDPLQHLIRNSLDHGIENKEERKNQGKNAQAIISLKVGHEAGKIQLLFEDDGRGINPQNVIEKAIKSGVVSEEQAKVLDEQQTLQLILQPGFSTSETITEISGRGVGLDVVLSNLKKAKGTLQIDSTVNKGTSFIITLPLTLATTRGLFVTAEKQQFMLPTLSLESLYTIDISQLHAVEGEQTYIVDDKPVPVKCLASVLNLSSATAKEKTYQGVLLNQGKQYFMILVDSIENEHDCVIKSLPEPFNKIPCFIGVTLTGLGKLVPVLNPKKLITLAANDNGMISATEVEQRIAPANRHILVVDDSLTTRSLTLNALRARGYNVSSAQDGELAWRKIQNEMFDCIITDIEMPNMDGYELTKKVKRHKDYQHIPLVIVSSLESEAQQKQGMACGANNFLIKSQFDTRTLLELIEDLL